MTSGQVARGLGSSDQGEPECAICGPVCITKNRPLPWPEVGDVLADLMGGGDADNVTYGLHEVVERNGRDVNGIAAVAGLAATEGGRTSPAVHGVGAGGDTLTQTRAAATGYVPYGDAHAIERGGQAEASPASSGGQVPHGVGAGGGLGGDTGPQTQASATSPVPRGV